MLNAALSGVLSNHAKRIAALAVAGGTALLCGQAGPVSAQVTTASASVTTAPLRIQDWRMSDKVSRPRSTTATVDTVIIHFSSDVIQHPENPYNPMRVRDIFTSYTVSAHYLIGRDGTVYRLVPEERAAFHAGTGKLPRDPGRKGNMNDYSIGIEILAVGSAKDMAIYQGFDYAKFTREHPNQVGYTDAQYAALNALLDGILKRHPAIKHDRRHILGHSEVDPKRKTDPGELFDWTRIGLPR